MIQFRSGATSGIFYDQIEKAERLLDLAKDFTLEGHLTMPMQTLHFCDSIGYPDGQVEIRLLLANYYSVVPALDSTKHYLDEALHFAGKDETLLSDVYDGFAEYEMLQQNYKRAYKNIEKSIQLAESANASHALVWALIRKGRLFAEIGDYEYSDSIFWQAAHKSKEIKASNPLRQIYLDLLLNCVESEDATGAGAVFDSIEPLLTDTNDLGVLAYFLPLTVQARARTFNISAQYDSAIVYLNRAQLLMSQYDATEWMMAVNHLESAKSNYNLQHYAEAQNYLSKIYSLKDLLDPEQKKELFWYAQKVASELGKYDEMRFYLEEYQKVNDENTLIEKKAREALKLHAQIELRNLEKKHDDLVFVFDSYRQSQSQLILLLCILLLCLGCIYLWHLVQNKNREIAVVEKTKIINEYKGDLEALRRKSAIERAALGATKLEAQHVMEQVAVLREIETTDDKAVVQKLREIQHQLQIVDSDWNSFRQSFQLIHRDFIKDLRIAHPNLTENELRHCAYLKLGLTNREVGNMLGINASSVKIARYRISKKLNHDDLSLATYLQRFG